MGGEVMKARLVVLVLAAACAAGVVTSYLAGPLARPFHHATFVVADPNANDGIGTPWGWYDYDTPPALPL